MRALDAGKYLSKHTAEEIMQKDRLAVTASTMIADATKQMDEHSVLILPLESDRKVACSVRHHDLLRAWIGLALGMVP
jgi:CBS-domain-containing membrane protein